MSSGRQRSSKTLALPVERKPSKYNVEGRRTALSFPLQSSIAQVQKNGLDSGDDEDNCGLSIEQILALKEQFDAADIDGGGSLDLSEFIEAFGSVIESSGKKFEDEQIERLFMQIDANSDGGIDWSEFSDYMLMESQANQTEIAEKVATFYLLDGTGSSHEGDWHQSPAICVTIEAVGGFCITASKDQIIRIWSPSLNLFKSIHIHDSGWILAMCVLPATGKLCTASADRRIRLYDIHTWDLSREILLVNAATCMCSWKHLGDEILAYGDDKGRVTFVNASKGFRVVETDEKDLPYGKEKGRLTFVNKSKGFANARADDRLESQFCTWESSIRKRLHSGWIHEIHMIEELGGIMSCGDDGAIVIYEYPPRYHPDLVNHKHEVVSRRTLKCKRGHSKGVRCIAWVNSQKVIASGGLERMIIIWNPYTGNQIAQLVGHQEGIEKLFYSAEYDQVLSLCSDRIVKVWDMVHSECIQTINSEKSRPSTMMYDPTRKRLITCGRRPYSWRVNPRILLPFSETTHRSEIVAVLLNRVFGQLVTVAEDTETCVWRVGSGRKIFSYFDTERDEDAPVSCATFDEAGRRLITGDHQGVVRVWNFNNGACLKILRKPPGADRRQEVTSIACYELQEKRFLAACGWDCRITVWVDSSDASPEPFLQLEGHDRDIVCMAFTYPKNLISCALDGSMHVFDMESGFRRLAGFYHQQVKPVGSQKSSVLPYVTALDSSARLSSKSGIKSTPVSEFSKAEYIERMCILLTKNKTLVTVGSDGNMCFWDGINFRLVLTTARRHAEIFGLVDVQTDKGNHFLVTGDQGGFVNVWDIKEYRCINPREDQVKKLSCWQAHEFAISAVDIVPYPKKGTRDSAAFGSFKSLFDYVVVTCSTDRKVLVWSSGAVLIGQLGQSREWILDNISTWESKQSLNSMGNDSVSLDRQVQIDTEELEHDDYEFLKTEEKPLTHKLPRLKSAKLQAIPEFGPESGKKIKKKDNCVDAQSGEKANRVPEKRMECEVVAFVTFPRALSPFMKSFAKKIDPENVIKEVFLGKKKEDISLFLRNLDKEMDPDQGEDGLKNESSA